MQLPITIARSEWLAEQRSDNTMAALPKEQFEAIADWRWNGRHSLARCREMAVAEGWEVPGPTAFAEFFASYLPFLRRALRQSQHATAAEIIADPNSSPEQISETIYRQHAAEVLTLQLDPSRDEKLYQAKLAELGRMNAGRLQAEALNQRAAKDAATIAQNERKIAMMEAKAKSTEETLTDATLTDEDKAARIRQIFGIAG